VKVRLFTILSVGLLACLAVEANATIFTGSATGTWVAGSVDTANGAYDAATNPTGDKFGINNNDAGPAVSDDALFWWGDPLTGTQWDTGSTRNEFHFNGVGSNGVLGSIDTASPAPFLLGNFDYTNGSAFFASGVDGVDLAIEFYIAEIGDRFSLTNAFTITNTSNVTGDPVLDGDIVTMLGTSLSHTFTYNSKNYQFDILGFSQDGGQTIQNNYSSPEDGIASAGLYGQLNEVPEPATLLLFGTGIIGLLGARRVQRRKA
jgi:PEP-CTERM motif